MTTLFDPTRVAHLGGRFAPVTEEVDAVDLDVVGELPRELDGVYLRNGRTRVSARSARTSTRSTGTGCCTACGCPGVARATATAS